MTQHVFLSYSREDRPIAQTIAKALDEEGFNVWWDKILKAGQTYDEVTEDHLRRSGAVIVLWSETSVKSRWVRAEATQGDRLSSLVPAMIEDAERPIMFELTQAADLIGWNGDRTDPRWSVFVSDIQAALERSAKKITAMGEAAAAAALPSLSETVEAEPDVTPTTTPTTPEPASTPPAPEPQPVAAAQTAASAPPTPQTEKSSGGGALWAVLALALLGGGAFGAMQFGLIDLSGTGEPSEADPVAEVPCELCPDMVSLPGGGFAMGSPDGNEAPVREVTLAPFSISKTEVTFADWDACVAGGGCGGYTPRGPEDGRDSKAVTRVSWSDAGAYAAWLSDTSGDTWRLPTEAEWEYAARGGTGAAYWWGEGYDGSKLASSTDADMSSLPANPFGLIGTSGTVREWVQDCYVPNYNDAPTDGSAVLSGDCQRRVVRGGYAGGEATDLRTSSRARVDRGLRDRRYGFRIVRED